jgi:hypothetical protein
MALVTSGFLRNLRLRYGKPGTHRQERFYATEAQAPDRRANQPSARGQELHISSGAMIA